MLLNFRNMMAGVKDDDKSDGEVSNMGNMSDDKSDGEASNMGNMSDGEVSNMESLSDGGANGDDTVAGGGGNSSKYDPNIVGEDSDKENGFGAKNSKESDDDDEEARLYEDEAELIWDLKSKFITIHCGGCGQNIWGCPHCHTLLRRIGPHRCTCLWHERALRECFSEYKNIRCNILCKPCAKV